MVFHFKQFDVRNDLSAMKVNTDGVLLGAAMTILPSDKYLLDIGTGTGTIALMAAQRLSAMSEAFHIEGIDVDEVSSNEASANFTASPWGGSMEAKHIALEDFRPSSELNLIFSNPPYFDCSLEAPELRRNNARHTTSLSYREILDFASRHLSQNGRVAMVLPSDVEHSLLRYARMCRLFPFRILRIRTVERKLPSRIIAEFSHDKVETPVSELLTIQKEGNYTQEYVSLTKDFYLSF